TAAFAERLPSEHDGARWPSSQARRDVLTVTGGSAPAAKIESGASQEGRGAFRSVSFCDRRDALRTWGGVSTTRLGWRSAARLLSTDKVDRKDVHDSRRAPPFANEAEPVDARTELDPTRPACMACLAARRCCLSRRVVRRAARERRCDLADRSAPADV